MSNTMERRWNRFFRLQFTLRWMLAIMAIASAFFGLYVAPALRQKKAVEFLRQRNVAIKYARELSDPPSEVPGPAWLVKRLGVDFFDRVATVSWKFHGNPERCDLAPIFNSIQEFRHARCVKLDVWSGNGQFDWTFLSNLSQVECLSIGGTFHDKDLQAIKHLNRLQALELSSPKTLGAGLVHLAQLTQLRTLKLRAPLDEAGFRELSQLTQLRELAVHMPRPMFDYSPYLAKLSGLRVGVIGIPEIEDKDIVSLARLQALELMWLPAQKNNASTQSLRALDSVQSLKQVRLYSDRLPSGRFSLDRCDIDFWNDRPDPGREICELPKHDVRPRNATKTLDYNWVLCLDGKPLLPPHDKLTDVHW